MLNFILFEDVSENFAAPLDRSLRTVHLQKGLGVAVFESPQMERIVFGCHAAGRLR